MGYMTDYRLSWTGVEPTTKPCEHCNGTGAIPVQDAVQDFVDSEPFIYGNTEPLSSALEDSCKWYEHEEDMKRLSLAFPDVLFTLKGDGEEAGDIWVKYFKGGKMQSAKAEIKLAQFDPKELQ